MKLSYQPLKAWRRILVPAVILVLIALWWTKWRDVPAFSIQVPEGEAQAAESFLLEEDIRAKLEPSYLSYYRAAVQDGAKDTEGFHLSVPAARYAEASPKGVSIRSGLGDLSGDSVVLEVEDSWVEYEIKVPQSGFYQMGLAYYAMEGMRSSVLRDVQVDGQYPFFQAKRLEFKRMFREAGEVWRDNQHNEYNPPQEEVYGWQYRELRDPDGKTEEPFRFYLKEGSHRVRIRNIREPAAFARLDVFSPVKLPAYAEVAKQYEEKGYAATKGHLIKVQAEDHVLKSDPTLRRGEDRDPLSEPLNPKGIGLNVFGGGTWRNGGQWIEWEFEVPEPGLYEIGTRYAAWWLQGFPVERIVTLDGKIPFREMNAAKFYYSPRWQAGGLAGQEGEPYLFHLDKGKHRLRMEVQVGSLGEVLEAVQDVSHNMSLLSREIILYTGTDPDPNRQWDLDENIPKLIPRLHAMAIRLDGAIRKMKELGVAEDSSELAPLAIAGEQIMSMAKDPDTIPRRLKEFGDTQSGLGTWATGLIQQSLQFDYLIVKSPDQPWPKANANWAKRFVSSTKDFFLSFRKNYEGVGNVFGSEEKVLDVWVARGRDWVQIIKQMADEDFTAKTGIKVNMNTIPAQQMQLLLLASTSGRAPDAALGVEAGIPIDFAVRGALVDLGEFDNYEKVASRFRPGALIPYRHQGGNYALPENQNFNMLFYRKDILEELGVKPPDTWEDVRNLIPLLQQKGMDFYYPHGATSAIGEVSPFLFQNGGDFYRENARRSALDSPEALKAVKNWTELFTNYKIAKEANFYNRFRTGEMPIGIADYNMYVLLSVAAPELTGWWEMRPMPGTPRSDGRVDRSTGGAAQTAVIFKDTKMKEEAWAFLDWWTSVDVQEQFGMELEALLGVEARWNTANVEALKRLPWPSKDIERILEQWSWFREREIVLGGYFTDRHIANVWNEIVLNGKNPREALEDGVREINKELRKKREEFGLSGDEEDETRKGEGGG